MIREGYYDKPTGQIKYNYRGYVGKSTTITLDRAKRICEKHDLTLEDLKTIRRLKIKEEVKNTTGIDTTKTS